MSNYEFATGAWRDKTQYSCYECNYYTFGDKKSVQEHCERTGHGRVEYGDKDDAAFIRGEAGTLAGVTLTLGLLCWNTKQVSLEGLQELVRETGRLNMLGVKADIVVIDNGSNDGTSDAMREYLSNLDCKFGHIMIVQLAENVGISKARNLIIERALVDRTDHVLFLDGDIQTIPFSVYAMAKYLDSHLNVGCIGAITNSTAEVDDATKRLYEIRQYRIGKDQFCAWTQYGLFRRSMLSDGVRFDESGPFGLPGWGFEDNDLCFQMGEAGWENHYFKGCTYLHRNLRSSWPNLKAAGVDVHKQYMERKRYLMNKWRGNPRVKPLAGIVNATGEPKAHGQAFR